MRFPTLFPLFTVGTVHTIKAIATNSSYCPPPGVTPYVRPSGYYGDIPGDVEELMKRPPTFTNTMRWNGRKVPYVPQTLRARLRLGSVRRKVKHRSLLLGLALDYFDSFLCQSGTFTVLDYCGQPKCVPAGRAASFSIGFSGDSWNRDSTMPKTFCYDISWFHNPNNDYLPNGPGVEGRLVSFIYHQDLNESF
jgi:hypothetical protein